MFSVSSYEDSVEMEDTAASSIHKRQQTCVDGNPNSDDDDNDTTQPNLTLIALTRELFDWIFVCFGIPNYLNSGFKLCLFFSAKHTRKENQKRWARSKSNDQAKPNDQANVDMPVQKKKSKKQKKQSLAKKGAQTISS